MQASPKTVERLANLIAKNHRLRALGQAARLLQLEGALVRVADVRRPDIKRLNNFVNLLVALHHRARAEAAENLGQFVSRIAELRNALRLARASPGNFNLFQVLRVRRREYVHSNVLAWLLDPLETHGLGPAFLNAVLTALGAPLCPEDQVLTCRIRREVSAATSIVDIVVETPGSLLIIENKIDAVEGAQQTDREYRDFTSRANGRRFSAIFLSLNGESPKAAGFTPWSYARIWQLLGALTPSPNIAAFVRGYRDILEMLLAKEGMAMARFKGYRPETKFVLEHYDDVRLLKEALDGAESDIGELLASVEAELQERDWWDEDGWISGKERGGVFVRKATWGTEEDSFWFGIMDLSLETLTSEDDHDRSRSYVYVRNDMRTEPVQAKLAAIGRVIDTKAQSNLKYPFWRSLSLSGIATDPSKLKETLLAEFDTLARFAAAIDDLAKPKSTKR